LGYLPRKKNERKRLIEQCHKNGICVVFLESPYRVVATLKDIKNIVGNKKIALAREMTKKFEEVFEADIDSAIDHFQGKKPKGEFTVVLDNKKEK